MDYLKRVWGTAVPRATLAEEYEPLRDVDETNALEDSVVLDTSEEVAFSWIEYSIFVLLGMAMLWAWYVTPKRYSILSRHRALSALMEIIGT